MVRTKARAALRGTAKAVLKAAAAFTPISQRLSPLFLGRITSFAEHCETVSTLPTQFARKDFYLPIMNLATERRIAPICLTDDELSAFWLQVTKYQEGLEIKAPPVFLAGIREASILSDGITVRSRDHYAFQEPFHIPEILAQNQLRAPFLPTIDRSPRGAYIHLGSLWCTAHYHWVLEVLPRFAILERFDELRQTPIILPKGITRAQYQSLALFGIDRKRIVEFDGSHWRVEYLYFPSLVGVSGNPTSFGVEWLRQRLVPGSCCGHRQIYISRNDASSRRILNEADLIKELTPLGFEVVCLAETDFPHQVRLFNEASVIIAPHGGGLTNCVFAPSGAVIIEVFAPNYINGCFWALANACGHRYGFLIGEQHDQDIKVDIKGILDLLGITAVSTALHCRSL
jgi:capsular polysaccharide biosynthesis protein